MRRTTIHRIKIVLIACYMAVEITGRRVCIVFDPCADYQIHYGPHESYRGVDSSIKNVLKGSQLAEEISTFFLKGSGSSQGLRDAFAMVRYEDMQRLLDRLRFEPDTERLPISFVVNTEASAPFFAASYLATLSPPAPPSAPFQLNI